MNPYRMAYRDDYGDGRYGVTDRGYRDRDDRDRDYREHGSGRDDRGFADRAADEVRSWFGDDEAERRRRMDEQERERERWRDRDHGRRHFASPEPARIFRERPASYGRTEEYYDVGYGGAHALGPWPAWRTGDGRWRDVDYRGRGPKGYQRSDTRIMDDVCDRLSAAPDLDASNIEVEVKDCEVTLKGSVEDRRDKRRAEDLAESVSGVKEVHNGLRVTTPEVRPGVWK